VVAARAGLMKPSELAATMSVVMMVVMVRVAEIAIVTSASSGTVGAVPTCIRALFATSQGVRSCGLGNRQRSRVTTADPVAPIRAFSGDPGMVSGKSSGA
jgi:hypothetical protein